MDSTPKAGGSVAKWLAIREQLGELSNLGPPQALMTVYYPIALLRMKLEEYSFEDFNAVERSILRFFAAGVTTAEEICRWMALPSARYIQERIALLRVEGLLDGDSLTALGRESLALGQKEVLYDGEQIFEADGLLGLLLPREYQIREERLIDRRGTVPWIPHLAHSESIAFHTIREAIEGEEKIRGYKRYRKSILNVNVRQITDIEVEGVKYTKALLAWFQRGGPLVFFPMHKLGERGHCDMPLFLPESLDSALPELSRQVELTKDERLDALSYLYNMALLEQRKQPLEGMAEWLRENTTFRMVEAEEADGKAVFTLDFEETELFSALELEILAAMGAVDCPVEEEMELDVEVGNGQVGTRTVRKRVRRTIWPKAAHASPRLERLAKVWNAHSWGIYKKTPMSLNDAIKFAEEQEREDA